MKKLFTLLILLTFLAGASWGQLVSQYGFATSAGSYTAITGGTLHSSGSLMDDAIFASIPIGFSFTFNGVAYTTATISENGYIVLGGTASLGYDPLNSATVAGGCIAAMARDLQGIDGTSELRSLLTGSAPNRTFVVQWQNMKRYGASYTLENLNVQLILKETSNTFDMIYGSCLGSSYASATHPQVGLRGAANTDFKVRTTTTNWAATTAGTTNLDKCTFNNLIYPAANLLFSWSPPPPCVAPSAQPTALNLTPALNSIAGTFTAAVGSENYLVVRSLSNSLSANPVNGTRYTIGTALGGGVVDYYGTGTSFTSGGLAPTTAYYYFVFSANDATCSGGPLYLTSGPLTNNTTTLSPGLVTSTGAGGLWSVPATWVGGVVPTATDDVSIVSGATVTVDAATNTCYSLTIDAGATVDVTGVAQKLTVNYNLTNNGTLDLGNAGLTAYADLTFAGAYNSTFTGSGATTDIYTLTVNKGSGAVTLSSPVLEISPANFTYKNVSTSTTLGFLQTGTFNGIVKFAGTFTLSSPVFLVAAYSIPSTGGFWLNNPNFTVAGLNGSPTMSGLFKITDGIFNIGTSSGNSMGFASNSKIYVEGGTINATGRFGVSTSSNTITYSQSGGAITVCTVGNSSTTLASFDLGTSTTSAITLNGGTVTIQLANTGASGPRDYRAPIGPLYPNFTGTTLYLGNASSGTAKIFRLIGSVMPMVFSTASANHSAAITGSVYYFGSLTIPVGCDLNLNGFGFWLFGATCVNDGTITATTASSRFDFANGLLGSTTQQDYSGTGTFGAGVTSLSLGINNAQNVILNAPINAVRVNLFLGLCKNAGFITIGNGASACVVQIGLAGATAPGGDFDVSPLYNLGTGTHTVLYAAETAPRVTGFEIPPARGITNVTVDNVNGVTVAGGDITLGAAGTLTLTSGILHTSAGNHLILGNTGAAVIGGSATTYVDGPLSRTFAASRTTTGSYTTSTLFPVGKGASYLPVWVHPDANAGGTVVVKSEAFLSNPGTAGAGVTGLSVNRWESVVTSGAANLDNSYLQMGDPAIVTGQQILQANAGNGVYGAIPSSTAFTAGTPNTLKTSGAPIPAASYYGYFAYGSLTPCSVPGNQATAFVVSALSATGFAGSFTAATSAPSHYLVVRYASGGVVTPPVDYTNYAAGASLGAGTVVLSSVLTTFTQSGLVAGTTYDYYVYSYNNSGCYGPVYLTTSPLAANVTTCATATGVPGTPTLTTNGITSFVVDWAASSTPGVTYYLDVATNSSFTTFVPGYQALNMGAALTATVSAGITPSTTYYVRVIAEITGCFSAYTGTLTLTTLCNAASAPFEEHFATQVMPSCWSISGPQNWLFTTSWPGYGATGLTDHTTGGGGSFAGVDGSGSTSLTGITLTSPLINVSTLTVPQLRFYVFNNNITSSPPGLAADAQTLRVDLWDGTAWNNSVYFWDASKNFATWQEIVVNLSSYAITGPIQFRFVVDKGSSLPFYDDMIIDDVYVEETPTVPALTAAPASLAFGYTAFGGSSAEQSYDISGLFLTGAPSDILITAPANFEVSLSSGSGFGPSVLLPYAAPTLGLKTIYVRCTPTVNGGNFSGNITNVGGGASVNVAVTGSSDLFSTYCTSIPSSAADEEIYSVTVNGATNAYDCSTVAPGPGSILNRYSNFHPLGSFTSMQLGQVVSFTILEDECDGATYYSNGCAIWIDFNQDGDLLDADEKVFVENTVTIGPRTITGTFAIPVGATLGQTKMRIIVAETYSGTGLVPCLSYSYGETEDYTVTISPATTPSLGATPLTLSFAYTAAGNMSTESSYVLGGLALSPAAGNIAITAPAEFLVCETAGGTYTSTLSVGYTGSAITKTIYVKFAPGSVGTFTGNITNVGGSASADVAVSGSSDVFTTYCTSIPSSSADDEIFSVTVNGATNAYDCSTVAPGPGSILNRYSNFHPLGSLTTMDLGQTVSFTILEDECDGATYYSNGCAIWIDYNQDGDFLDVDEQVYVEATTTLGPRTITGSFVIPAGATTGITNMRIIVAESISGTSLVPCLSYSWGETEDYKVTINAPSTKTVNVKAYIQGYWNGTAMNQVQDADIDYNVFNKFTGTTVDTLAILLAEENSPWGYVFEAHGVNINPDGSMSITVPASFSGNYYIVIKQRNTVETWSANAVSFSGGTINYDFTDFASKAYGSNQFDLNGDGSVWGLYSGDFTSSTSGLKDEYVDFFDLNEIFNLNLSSAFGFQAADITGDGFVDFFDVNMAYNNNLNSVGMNTPPNPAKRPLKKGSGNLR